jgi:hypothetical protein
VSASVPAVVLVVVVNVVVCVHDVWYAPGLASWILAFGAGPKHTAIIP